MSTRKHPLAELPLPPQSRTPLRYTPSTPHAVRALQQRSGAKTRSARNRRLVADTIRPGSTRGILRRLAKITAPTTTRTLHTPITGADKENEQPEDEDEEGPAMKKPRMTFDIDESIDEDEEPPEYEEEDSDLPLPPSSSILPDEEDRDATLTFKSIDFAKIAGPASEKIDRRKSRLSFAGLDEGVDAGDDDDLTILSQMGRRAISEEPTGRLSRYSFGSLRMSDFGTELEVRRESDATGKTRMFEDYGSLGFDDPGILEGETEDLGRLARSVSPPGDETGVQIPAMDNSFRLDLSDNGEGDIPTSPERQSWASRPLAESSRAIPAAKVATPVASPDLIRQRPEAESSTSTVRRKRVKMTRHGAMVPSLPSSVIKRIAIDAQTLRGSRRPKLGREHVKALEQATDWFFEQVGEDLEAFANHARRRKRVDASDAFMLMRRQRLLTEDGSLRQLASDWLPKDVFEGIDLPERL